MENIIYRNNEGIEYIQFKRAYFDCASLDGKGNSGVTYDKDTGRIISMNFVFSGKIE